MELTGKMKGSTGTIKSMALHKTAPYLGVVGSDRFLRIYNLVLKKMTFKLYLRQKLSTLLFLKEDMIKDVDISDEEDMETVRPMQEKKGLNFLPKKTKKQTIKLAYLKEEELKSEEETPIPKTKKKIKKMAMLKNEDMLSDEEEVPQVKKSKKTYKK